MKKIIFSLFLVAAAFGLTACVPAVFVAGAAAGAVAGVVVNDNRQASAMVDDQNITARADLLISQDKDLKFRSNLTLTTFNHIVLLLGQTPKEEYRDRVVKIIQGIPKVKRIYNEIKIAQPTSISSRPKDAWITTKAKASLLAEKGLHSSQIKVVTESREVYLMGLVTHTQADLAALVVSKIKGVARVIKLFEYVE
jgi:osmotically-inducible protein OsmY